MFYSQNVLEHKSTISNFSQLRKLNIHWYVLLPTTTFLNSHIHTVTYSSKLQAGLFLCAGARGVHLYIRNNRSLQYLVQWHEPDSLRPGGTILLGSRVATRHTHNQAVCWTCSAMSRIQGLIHQAYVLSFFEPFTLPFLYYLYSRPISIPLIFWSVNGISNCNFYICLEINT